jgi:cobalt-precorrin 5A hydrolase / cobalt-factor III methyltransferase / precorrin-3B C17-methyltransferase
MPDMTPCLLIFTRHALPLARRLAQACEGRMRILAPAKVIPALPPDDGVELYEEPASQAVGALLRTGCPLIGIASVGLIVRLLAQHLRGKEVDPPVVVVDEGGRFVVPVLSGHLGGANALAERLATHIGAIPVVTTATEALGTLPIDRVAAEEGWQIEDFAAVKAVARCLVNGEPVVIVQECGATEWRRRFDPLPATISDVARWEDVTPGGYHGGILISDRAIPDDALQAVAPSWVVCRPSTLVVGVGAEKDVPAEDLDGAVQEILHAFGLAPRSVATIATLDRKAVEDGFRAWLARRGWPVVAYTADQLAQVYGMPNPSDIVAQAVGTPGVCEPAAILASENPTLLVPKQKRGRVTVAVARKSTMQDGQGHITSHSAEPSPSTSLLPHQGGGHRGRLAVIGIGPGAPDLLTVRAISALERAEVVVGYERYIELLGSRVAGKEIRGSAIGREIDRARLALDLARRGREVALISSGDAGIYGMGGLVFEQLQRQGWHPGDAPQVEVIPGVTAAQASASLLGAPLSNDFAVLSLSDLLTPRDVIERRLAAVAAADMVVALYNPQSQKRRALFQQACQTFLRHRSATTPVAVVRAAYRDGQVMHLGELGQLAEMPVDMESLVLIGNSQTQRFADHLVTARGYESARLAGDEGEAQDRNATSGGSDTAMPTRKILFVGAGPGDPELLTLKAAQALAAADVVVYAGSLVPRGVLTHVRPGARLHNSATLTLEATHRLLTEGYRAGQQVVRLHSGDPSLYGAISEQMTLLDAEQIPYDIIPGVSAFQAVAARLGIEYTVPGVVQTVILTRPGGRTGLPPNESLQELARHGVTLCLFLSARHVAEVQETLLTSYAPETPVAVAYRATWPDEELTSGTLGQLVEMVQGQGYERTTLIIVGPSLQRHAVRSRLYDASHWHLFRPEKRREASGGR